MQITYKYNGLEEAKKLTDLMEQKLESLRKFIDEGTPALCEVEFEKVAAQNSGNVFRVEVNATVNGTLYRADAVEDSFEKAIDEVRAELDKEMRRSKDKQVTLDKSAGREMKEQMLDT